ncbi:unnamed protein product [Prorocentrum cordatum]|uniref:Subtilisin n=1 Tax=Prorocentrum cordatum TaxID=2364126 RepID=A0ABN9QCM0_9DINO|nr:unnamed protein product [Polarella glacialis]
MEQLASRQMGENTIDRTANIRARSNYNGCERQLHGLAGARRAAASRDAGVRAPVLAAGAAALLVADGRHEEGLHGRAGARRAAASLDAGVPAPVLAASAAALLVADGRHEEGLHGRAGARRAAASRDAGVPAPVLAAGAAALLVADGRREEGLHALAGARRAAASRDADDELEVRRSCGRSLAGGNQEEDVSAEHLWVAVAKARVPERMVVKARRGNKKANSC